MTSRISNRSTVSSSINVSTTKVQSSRTPSTTNTSSSRATRSMVSTSDPNSASSLRSTSKIASSSTGSNNYVSKNKKQSKNTTYQDSPSDCCPCKGETLDSEAEIVTFHRQIFSNRSSVSLSDFHTVAVIGQGGYAIVRLVFDKMTGHIYALKQAKKSQLISNKNPDENSFSCDTNVNLKINNSYLSSLDIPSTINTGLMLNTEISLMYSSKSEWITRLYYYWEDSHFYYMLMEYMPGGDMMRHLMEYHTFDENTAKFYIAEVILALDYLHNNQEYIHRDIKPDNILLDEKGHIKLVDFGLSRNIKNENKQHPFVSNVANELQTSEIWTVPTNIIKTDPKVSNKKSCNSTIVVHDPNFQAGTPDYMAPEIHRGEPYSLSADLWSVGIIIYEMLFGGPPLSDPGQNSLITRKKVMNWDKYFYLPSEHHKYSKDALDLICSLVCEPQNRLKSTREVMKHPFFRGINFTNVRSQKAPIKPVIKHSLDHSNFDNFPLDTIINFYKSSQVPYTLSNDALDTFTNNITNYFGINSGNLGMSSFEVAPPSPVTVSKSNDASCPSLCMKNHNVPLFDSFKCYTPKVMTMNSNDSISSRRIHTPNTINRPISGNNIVRNSWMVRGCSPAPHLQLPLITNSNYPINNPVPTKLSMRYPSPISQVPIKYSVQQINPHFLSSRSFSPMPQSIEIVPNDLQSQKIASIINSSNSVSTKILCKDNIQTNESTNKLTSSRNTTASIKTVLSSVKTSNSPKININNGNFTDEKLRYTSNLLNQTNTQRPSISSSVACKNQAILETLRSKTGSTKPFVNTLRRNIALVNNEPR
ncbi:protein kinase domain-containing protein [Cryptosporidium andersoni]|uniref:non-specific serine/threonine protein kinase n=1 Tax=Cryptosporidium andersoni TaxID=117008 RepID=A0A1J4MB61_9CRYT|nr:protein kinase domain-containing protein [Cryptosporidium andersoni]